MLPLHQRRSRIQEGEGNPDEWVENFAFIDYNEKLLCLICKVTVTNYKVSILRRDYEANHHFFLTQYPLNSKLRKDKFQLVFISKKSGLREQQGILSFN